MHYVIGDVHGHYDTLMELVAKLPKDAKLVFVGDLIDRGPKSAEVIRFVREGNHSCVMGNHEELMIRDMPYIFSAYEKNRKLDLSSTWFRNGGIKTLISYGIIKSEEKRPQKVDNPNEVIRQLKSDLEWMESLPLYLQLDIKHASGKPVVISHSCIGSVWHFRDDSDNQHTFREYALWSRGAESGEMPIFNIFGHTPTAFGVGREDYYLNVDTGCYSNEFGYGELSAYCVETGAVASVDRRLKELKLK